MRNEYRLKTANSRQGKQPVVNYGNWIRRRIIIIMMAMGILAILLGSLPIYALLRTILLMIGGATLATSLFVLYVYVQFSARGGDYQGKLWSFLMEHLRWNGADK